MLAFTVRQLILVPILLAFYANSVAGVERQEAIVPVIVEGQSRGEIYLELGPETGQGAMEAASFVAIIEPFLDPLVLSELQEIAGGEPMLKFSALSAVGIDLEFDALVLVLRVHLPPDLRSVRSYRLNSYQRAPGGSADIIDPSSFSGALDGFVSSTWQRGGRRSDRAELDAHLNVNGWVLESRHDYQSDGVPKWQRRQTRLVYEWPVQRLRLNMGDLTFPSLGLMGSRPLSGVSLSTSFSVVPNFVSFPVSREEFYLERESTVEIFVAGNLRDRRVLPAGRHRVLDLPLVDGVNEVILEITDTFGRQQTLRFFTAFDRRLLQPFLAEYAVTFGVPRIRGSNAIEYVEDNLSLTAFYRRGITENLTLGAHFEQDDEVRMFGITSTFNTLWGNVDLDLALSRDQRSEAGDAAAVALDYRYRFDHWSVNARLMWQDEDFSNLSQPASADNVQYILGLGFSPPTVAGWRSHFALLEEKKWRGSTRRSQRLSLGRELSNRWRVDFNVSRIEENSGSSTEALMQFTWNPSGRRTHARISYASPTQEATTEVSYRRQGELGLDLRATALHSADQNQQTLAGSYVSTLTDGRFTTSRRQTRDGTTQRKSTIGLGMALAFADGWWALSRPLNAQPFAILTGNASLGDSELGVIRGAGDQVHTILDGAGGRSVVPNIAPYYTSEINLDVNELPIGMQISRQQFRVKPGYRQGVLLEIGSASQVYLVGTLHDATNSPVSYGVGTIRPLDRPDAEALTLFTDQQGHFEVADIDSGSYQIFVRGMDGYYGRLQIPENSRGRVEIGVVSLGLRDEITPP